MSEKLNKYNEDGSIDPFYGYVEEIIKEVVKEKFESKEWEIGLKAGTVNRVWSDGDSSTSKVDIIPSIRIGEDIIPFYPVTIGVKIKNEREGRRCCSVKGFEDGKEIGYVETPEFKPDLEISINPYY